MAKQHSSDHISATFAALADPTRRAILARLASGETSVKELAAPLDISFPGLSKHLKVLENAGLISRGRRAQWRPCRLERGRLRDVEAWVQLYRRNWEQSSEFANPLSEYMYSDVGDPVAPGPGAPTGVSSL